MGAAAASSGPAAAAKSSAAPQHQAALKEVQALYKHHGDLSLKEGQTIHVHLKASSKPKEEGASGSLGGSTGASGVVAAPAAGGLFKLAPPPGQPAVPPPATLPAAPVLQAVSVGL